MSVVDKTFTNYDYQEGNYPTVSSPRDHHKSEVPSLSVSSSTSRYKPKEDNTLPRKVRKCLQFDQSRRAKVNQSSTKEAKTASSHGHSFQTYFPFSDFHRVNFEGSSKAAFSQIRDEDLSSGTLKISELELSERFWPVRKRQTNLCQEKTSPRHNELDSYNKWKRTSSNYSDSPLRDLSCRGKFENHPRETTQSENSDYFREGIQNGIQLRSSSLISQVAPVVKSAASSLGHNAALESQPRHRDRYPVGCLSTDPKIIPSYKYREAEIREQTNQILNKKGSSPILKLSAETQELVERYFGENGVRRDGFGSMEVIGASRLSCCDPTVDDLNMPALTICPDQTIHEEITPTNPQRTQNNKLYNNPDVLHSTKELPEKNRSDLTRNLLLIHGLLAEITSETKSLVELSKPTGGGHDFSKSRALSRRVLEEGVLDC